MIFTPDMATLALCDMMMSAGFALVFFIIWTTRRAQGFLLDWGMCQVCYVASLLGMAMLGAGATPVAMALLLLLIPLSDLLILVGVRRFHHQRLLSGWMILPLAGTALGALLPSLTAGWELGFHAKVLVREAPMIGIALTKLAVGSMLCCRRGRVMRGGRLAGAALLGYVPTYLLTFALWHADVPFGVEAGMLPMLADQVLLPILSLGLLWKPAELASDALRESALRDPLTGAWNRRWLDTHRAQLSTCGSAVILIDIDHFKVINDRHGHAHGDAVLVAFAERAHAVLERRGGCLVRLGGDEFLVVTPIDGPVEVQHIAEALRFSFATGTADAPAATASLGVALIEDDADLSRAMARADASLYRAKAAGRDRAMLAS
jgi:diguanylate cyclase (GGDEF)-like protein